MNWFVGDLVDVFDDVLGGYGCCVGVDDYDVVIVEDDV